MVETLKEKLPNLEDKTLKKELEKNNIEIPGGYNRGLAISKLFEKYFEETLIQPTFVIDYPKETTPLCKPHRENKDYTQ